MTIPRETLIDVQFWLHNNQSFKLLKLSQNAQISDVKSLLCCGSDMNIDECEIIFCGHSMNDEKQLHYYNIGPKTVLHVVKRQFGITKHIEHKRNYGSNRIAYLTGIWIHRQHTYFPFVHSAQLVKESLVSKYPKFYVYCKRCQDVRTGKLRVRCSSCKSESVLLHRDPQEWNDVLQTKQILATCRSPKCDCDICDAEFYFKCETCQKQSTETFNSNESSAALPSVKTNVENILCVTCFDMCDPIVTFNCDVEHVMCLSCFELYARNKLRERQMVIDKKIGYSVPCPNGCRDSFMPDIHLFHILGIDEYSTYQAFAAEECLIREMKGMVCPNPNCGTGLFPDLALDFEKNTKITCSSCGYLFCSTCRENFHGNSNCDSEFVLRPGNSAMVRDYLASIKTIKEISKKCPSCKVPTERSGGCMHMTCKMCEHEWCWNCLTNWSRECQANHWFT